MLRSAYTHHPLAVATDDLSGIVPFLRRVLSGAAHNLSHSLLAEVLPTAAVLTRCGVAGLDVTTLCRQWTDGEAPMELRKAVAIALAALATPASYLPLALCPVVVALLYDEEDEVRPLASAIVGASAVQDEVAVERHFALVARHHPILPRADLALAILGPAPSAQGFVQQDLIFDVEAPNYYIEGIQVAQYYAAIARAAKHNEPNTDALDAFLSATTTATFDAPFGNALDWPGPWSDAYRTLVFAWAVDPAALPTVVFRLGLSSVDPSTVSGAIGHLLRDGALAKPRDVLCLLSPEFLASLKL